MTTHRVTDRTRFVVVDQTTVNDASLSFRARGILVWLLDKPDDWRVDARSIARAGTEGRDAVLTALAELETAGYLRRSRSKDAQHRWTSTADVHEVPEVGIPGPGPADSGNLDPLQVSKPATQQPAAVKSEPLSLDLSDPTPDPVVLACQAAAEATARQERAAGRRISNITAWARPRAVDYQDRHGQALAVLAANGADVEALTAYVLDAETSLLPPVARPRLEPVRPRLTEFQASFEDTQAWADGQPVDIDAHRAAIAEARGRLSRDTANTAIP